MQRFQRLALALVAATVLVAGLPQRSDADSVFIGAGIGISVDFGPPALPVYVQPPAPYANAIWQPGYWAWGPNGYFWVPGTWVTAPRFGYLWTPGYWGFTNGLYYWHAGYWATHIGFYGGINYGFGYFGRGYVGGGWFGNAFRYNTAVTNVDTTIVRNVYVDRTVIVNNYNTNVTRVSYNGGDGVRALPTDEERSVAAEPHLAMTSEQRTHVQLARSNRNYLASVNQGRPADAVAAQPLTHENQPAHFEAITPSDRSHASNLATHVQTNGQPGYHPEALARPAQPVTVSRPAQPAEMARPVQPGYHPRSQPAYHPQPKPAYHPQQPKPATHPQSEPHPHPTRPRP